MTRAPRLTTAMLDAIAHCLGWAEAGDYEEIVQDMSDDEAERFAAAADRAHQWVDAQRARRAAKKASRGAR